MSGAGILMGMDRVESNTLRYERKGWILVLEEGKLEGWMRGAGVESVQVKGSGVL